MTDNIERARMNDDDSPDHIVSMAPIDPEFKLPSTVASKFEQTEAFDKFVDSLLAEDQESPLSNVVANAVMVLFRPSFVIIGSGHTHKTPAGFSVPSDVGIALNSANDFTPVDLVALLETLVEGYKEAVNEQFEVPNE